MNKVVLLLVVVFCWSYPAHSVGEDAANEAYSVSKRKADEEQRKNNLGHPFSDPNKINSVTEQSASKKPESNNSADSSAVTSGAAPSGEAKTEGDLDADKAGQSLQSHKIIADKLSFIEGLKQRAESNSNLIKINPVGHDELMKFGREDYIKNKQACVDRHERAAYMCIEVYSSHMIDGAAALNSIAAIGGVAVNDKCSKFAGAMDIASKALNAYTAACGAAKLMCGHACTNATEGIENMLKTIPTAKLNCSPTSADPILQSEGLILCKDIEGQYENALKVLSKEAQAEQGGGDKLSVAGKKSLCTEKYTQLAMSAVAGIAALAQSIMQGKDCKKNTDGAPDPLKVALPNLPATPPSAEKCADPAYASLPECLCLKNPRTPGCANAYQKPGESNGRQLTADPGSRFKTNDRGIAGLPGSSGIPGIDPRNVSGVDGGGSAASGSSGGGGAGLGGGGGGSGGGAAPGAGQDGAGGGIDLSKYDTGFAGGGGGGGRWGGGNGSSKYRAYLPGGAKDPRKNLAGQQAWTKEVTGQAGKSNWEKVKDRYRDNKSTLLNN